MIDTDSKVLTFPNDSEFQLGAVTYRVTAHFASEQETLKSKILHLLSEDIYKQSADKIAMASAVR